MTEKRIQELRAMLDRGTIQKRHIEEMLKALEENNVLMSAVNKIAAAGSR
jgi:hypothetical protein